jgi:hypothetical protein
VVGGSVLGDMGYHSASFGVFFLAFGVFERRTIFFCHLLYILSKFYHVGRRGCCAVVLGGWLLRAVAGVHKSYATKAPPCTLTGSMYLVEPRKRRKE